MADIVTRIARQVRRVPPPPEALPRFEIADLLARVDAAIARRAH
jgi:hypothetical protein